MTTSRKRVRVERHGRLLFYAGRDFVVTAGTNAQARKLFRLQFGGDGSIYVPFPYLETKRGLLAEIDPGKEPDPRVLNLARGGVVVTYDVKFSFKRSGWVRFSKDGEDDDLLPRRKSFALAEHAGQIFELGAYHVDGFAPATASLREGSVRLPVPSGSPHIYVRAEWMTKASISERRDPNAEGIGPDITIQHRQTGEIVRGILLGQHHGSPLRDHLLVLLAGQVPAATGADTPTLILRGGFDEHATDATPSGRALAFMYPYHGPDTWISPSP